MSGGEFRPSQNKRFEPVVVFVHHFGGRHSSSLRHQNMMLKMGFDCYAFDLSFNEPPNQINLPAAVQRLVQARRESVIEVWRQELKTALDQIDRAKIIFSFSFPSVTVPALLAEEPRTDVLAWITDGGPFLDEWKCMWNLFTWAFPVPNLALRALRTTYGFVWLGGLSYDRNVQRWMNRIEPRFPILSIRGGKDILVPPAAIAKFFATNPGLNLAVLDLPEAGHLDGLKLFPQLYRTRLESFLQTVGD